MPGKFDEGQPMYDSDLYAQLLPHTVTLTRLRRQNEESEELFIAVSEDLRLRKCCETTADSKLTYIVLLIVQGFCIST